MADALDTEPVAVRVALPADAATLAEIHARCFERGWDAQALSRFLGVPGCLVLVVGEQAGGSAQGFLIARAAADEAELLTLCVSPPYRRHGLARALLGAAAGMLAAGGAKRLFLEVDEGNEAALGLYRALGADVVGRRAAYYEHGGAAAIFSLALCGSAPDDNH